MWLVEHARRNCWQACRAKTEKPERKARAFGVADGARTRDTQDHNLVLYQLNYSHHRCVKATNYRLTHAA